MNFFSILETKIKRVQSSIYFLTNYIYILGLQINSVPILSGLKTKKSTELICTPNIQIF